MKIKEGSLRVWWIPQVPSDNPFRVEVSTVNKAKLLVEVLGNYDAYQFENDIKPDYCNTGGLEVFEDGKWVEWEDEEGNNVEDAEVQE